MFGVREIVVREVKGYENEKRLRTAGVGYTITIYKDIKVLKYLNC